MSSFEVTFVYPGDEQAVFHIPEENVGEFVKVMWACHRMVGEVPPCSASKAGGMADILRILMNRCDNLPWDGTDDELAVAWSKIIKADVPIDLVRGMREARADLSA